MSQTTYRMTIDVTIDEDMFQEQMAKHVREIQQSGLAQLVKEFATAPEETRQLAVNGVLSSVLQLIYMASGNDDFPTKYGPVNIPMLNDGTYFALGPMRETQKIEATVKIIGKE